MKKVKVSVIFIYDKEDDKDENYYQDKAFNEIYNSDCVLDNDAFWVTEEGD